MLLFLTTSGIILSVLLLYFNARSYKSYKYLGAFFFLVSLYGLTVYALLYSKSVFLVSIMFINFSFLSYLIGPTLYWYIRGTLRDDPGLRKRDLWHLLPAFIFLATSLPYIFGPYSEKIRIASGLVENVDLIGKFKPTILYRYIPFSVIFLSRVVHVFLYVVWSAAMVIRYLRQKNEVTVLSGQQYMTKWLLSLLGFLFILVISHFILLAETFSIKDTRLFYTLNFMQVFSAVGLAGLMISPLFFPAIIYGLPRIRIADLALEVNPARLQKSVADQKKKLPDFEADYLKSIEDSVVSCMLQLKPYLQHQCNLALISRLTDLPAHHLAYYFRVQRKQSFTDFRNAWRVSHAKNLMDEGLAKEVTLEGIGLLSGFTNRNTFFNSFKKVEGITPGSYQEKISA